MSWWTFVPTGPRKVTAKNQVSIPDDLLKAIGVLGGSRSGSC